MISVIVPVYNCIDTLERCVRAICAQTISDWELLLVNDGSTDGSGQMCDRLASNDSRIRVLHKPNGGVSSARNTGLDNALGDYVMFCDSDDWVDPDWCETLYRAVQCNSDSLPVCNYYRSGASGETVNCTYQYDNCDTRIPTADFFSLNSKELLGIPWNKIYRRDLVEQRAIRFRSELSLGEDLVFVLDYLESGIVELLQIPKPLYHYAVGNSESLSVKYYPDIFEIYRILYSRIKQVLCNMQPAWENWRDEYFRSYFYAFDRVFRNTLSAKNLASTAEKHRYNAKVFASNEFQECRRAVLPDHRNILQKAGLKSNTYFLYWTAVVVSEKISKYLHH